MRTISFVLLWILVTTAALPVRAQDGLDAGDLWRRVRHHTPATAEQPPTPDVEPSRPFFVLAPSVGSKPSTGINGGIAGNVAFVTGESSSTHLSSISGGLKVSQKG
ncbi:MAG TPA: hypothetical protein VFP91_17160, partial [Vicinamibacterales bacterium]|nr:hypothetical protein [Vicinamibacterales bacterium]